MSEMIEVILTGGASDTLEAFVADLKQAIVEHVEDDETRNRVLGLFAFLEMYHRRGHVYHTARHIMHVGQLLGSEEDKVFRAMDRKRREDGRRGGQKNRRMTDKETARRTTDWQAAVERIMRERDMNYTKAAEHVGRKNGVGGRCVRKYTKNPKHFRN